MKRQWLWLCLFWPIYGFAISQEAIFYDANVYDTYFELDTAGLLNGDGLAMVYRDLCLAPNDTPENWLRLEQASNAGIAEAQYQFGLLYLNSPHIENNEKLASRWLRRAAQQGHIPAQYDVAIMYIQGFAMEPARPAKAAGWFHQASKQGYARAQSNFAWMFEYGIGVRKSDYMAGLWYQEAAGRGDLAAQLALANLYLTGRGMGQDLAQSLQYYQRAAWQGSTLAQVRLNELYYLGLSNDDVRADRGWLENDARLTAQQLWVYALSMSCTEF